MPATDRYQLLVESQTRGEADIRRFNETLARLADVVSRSNDRTARSTEDAQRRTSAAFRRLDTDARTLGDSVRRSIENPISSATDKLLEGAAGMSKYAAAAAGVVVGLGALSLGLRSVVQEASEAAREVNALSLSTGLTTGEADRMRAAMKLTGFEASNFKEAALDLAVALKDTSGQGAETRNLMRQLGVSMYTSTGQTRAINEVLTETITALSKIEDTTKRVNLSRVLGGEDAAKNIQPFLLGLNDANRRARELGFGTRDGLLKALTDANKELKTLDLQWEILKGKLASGALVPIRFVSQNFDKFVRFLEFASPIAQANTAAGNAQTFQGNLERRAAPLGEIRRPPPPGLPDFAALNREIADRVAGQGLSERFRSGLSNTETGIKTRLDQIAKDRADIQAKLSSGSLSASAFKTLEADLSRLESETATLELRAKRIELARSGAILQIDSGSTIGSRSTRVPSLRGRASSLPDLPEFQTSEAAIAAANPDTGQAAAFGQGLISRGNQERQRALEITRQELEFQTRKIELLTSPGGERAAIEQITALRLAALEQERELNGEMFDFRERKLEIEEERTLRLLELDRQRRDEARALTSDLVGSLQSGNLRGFFRQEGSRLLNQIGTNAISPLVERTLGGLSGVLGQTGLGGLLAGTILDPANATPIDRNTSATDRNTAALERITATTLGAGVAGTSGIGGAAGSAIRIFGSDTNGITGRGGLGGLTGGLGSVATAGLFSGLTGGDKSVQLAPGFASTTSALGLNSKSGRAGNIIGSAAVLGTATLGAIDGFRRGGVSGNTQGIGSVLAAASLIPGPQQPFVAAGALIAGFVGAMLPDPKKQRDRQIDQLISDARYDEPAAMMYNVDRFGRSFDMNARGGYRPMDVTVVVNTMDAKSFSDNREMISDAVRQAAMEGHGINRTMREVVLGV